MEFECERGHDTIEHTADMGICGWGRIENDAFEEAALAMFELMVDGEDLKPTTTVPIEVEGKSPEELLIEFLNALLMKADIEELAFLSVDIDVIFSNDLTGDICLRAGAHGIPRGIVKDRLLREVKAATYCGASVERAPSGRCRVTCVLDL